jgi:hypothetical protein
MAAESKLKAECRNYVVSAFDGRLVQVSAKSWNGFPDSILLVPHCPPVFIEFKAKGGRPRGNQIGWGRWLDDNRFRHWLIDNFERFEESIEDLLIDHHPRSK